MVNPGELITSPFIVVKEGIVITKVLRVFTAERVAIFVRLKEVEDFTLVVVETTGPARG